MRPPITTHVLDTSAGRPAAGVAVDLDRLCAGSGRSERAPLGEGVGAAAAWERVASSRTNKDGRCMALLPAGAAAEGVYRCGLLVPLNSSGRRRSHGLRAPGCSRAKQDRLVHWFAIDHGHSGGMCVGLPFSISLAYSQNWS